MRTSSVAHCYSVDLECLLGRLVASSLQCVSVRFSKGNKTAQCNWLVTFCDILYLLNTMILLQ